MKSRKRPNKAALKTGKPVVTPAFEVEQKKTRFYVTKLPASFISKISYAAIRGQTEEPGAVQRVLNTRRIIGIKNFAQTVGVFPGTIVLNWSSETPLKFESNTLEIPDGERLAQIIDGQHRVAGIRAAIQEDAQLGEVEIPVSIYVGLETRQCADIFISINTEQKPVPKSLVFDLYGIASEPVVDPAALRARDIAESLNEVENSPYWGEIKMPGMPTRKGGIALSTAVSAIKPLVEDKGIFDQIGVVELELQKTVIFNLFNALKDSYLSQWHQKDNPFMYAAGFSGAIEFLKLKLVIHCNEKRSFKKETILEALDFAKDGLIHQEELKGLSGGQATKHIYERLVGVFCTDGKLNGQVEF